MKLKELIDNCDTEKIVNKVKELYPEQEGLLDEYRNLINKLKNMQPSEKDLKNNKLVVYVSHVWECFSEDESEVEEYDDVSGYNYDEHESYGIEFSSFSEWLAFDVCENSLRYYGEEAFLAHVLWEMSFISFDESDIHDQWEDLMKISEEVTEAIKTGDDSKFVTHVFDSDSVRFSDKERELMDKYADKSREFQNQILGLDS